MVSNKHTECEVVGGERREGKCGRGGIQVQRN